MRLKKNHDKDLGSKRTLYFILGLLLILAMVYIALEWKTEDDNDGFDIGEFQHTARNQKLSSVVFTTDMKSSRVSNAEDSIQRKGGEKIEIPFCPIDGLEPEIVTFQMVQQAPIFPGCENEPDTKRCFSKLPRGKPNRHSQGNNIKIRGKPRSI